MKHWFRKAPATGLIHLAFVVIVAGALITHFFGVTGSITLRQGDTPRQGILPFKLQLLEAQTLYHRGTPTPCDFTSRLQATWPNGRTEQMTVAMNRVVELDGWRLYQSAMGQDVSTLSISHDPWGIGVTYTGYLLLLLGLILFFVQRRSVWRGWLRRLALPAALAIAPMAQAAPLEVQRPLAREFGRVYVYWNQRVVPMHTMALDVEAALYGKKGCPGVTPEQMLMGWLLDFDSWEQNYRRHTTPTSEQEQLLLWLATGDAFKLFPYHSAAGHTEWLSLVGRRPSQMPQEQWLWMCSSMPQIGQSIASGHNVQAAEQIHNFIARQRHFAGAEFLPSNTQFEAELLYNRIAHPLLPAIVLLLAGLSGMLLSARWVERLSWGAAVVALAYVVLLVGLRGYVGQHIPLSNGLETMLCMSVVALVGAAVVSRRLPMLRPALLIVAGAALAVAAMSDCRPRIGAIAPVLESPLLSIHVMLVISSYALFMVLAILAVRYLVQPSDKLLALSHVLLLPALFLLTAGIFIGAVWANQSWGRYWGWDPKETCALITMLIYALPLHLRLRPRTFQLYMLIAILSVLFTYFGANYLLPGLHSYA